MIVTNKLVKVLRSPDDNPGGGNPQPKDPNVGLLLDKIKGLEDRIAEQDKRIEAVTDFNRKLLNGAKPANPSDDNKKSKFDAYMKE